MNFAPYLSLPPWRAVSINNTWELGESIRGYPCEEESDGGWALKLLGRESARVGVGRRERQRVVGSRGAPTMPLLFIEEILGGAEVSGVASVMHHQRERRGRESAMVRGTSGHGCNWVHWSNREEGGKVGEMDVLLPNCAFRSLSRAPSRIKTTYIKNHLSSIISV